MDQWVACREFPDHYEISSEGRVRRKAAATGTRVGRVRKGVIHRNGYVQFMLSVHNKGYMRDGHRLVADAFSGPIGDGLQVNHINGDKADNRLVNLEIVTNGENRTHSYRVLGIAPNRGKSGAENHNAKFGSDVVAAIKQARKDGQGPTAIARQYGVSRQTIHRISKGLTRVTG